MAAKRYFHERGKPAEAVVLSFRDEKSCLGQIVLCSEGLHSSVVGKAVYRHNGCGIARESAGSEGVKLEDRHAHEEPRDKKTSGVEG
jgi:hypothetical protein